MLLSRWIKQFTSIILPHQLQRATICYHAIGCVLTMYLPKIEWKVGVAHAYKARVSMSFV